MTSESVSMREHIGDVLRLVRRHQGRTLRDVSSHAQVSLGYLSEIERGQKEASSELLHAICQALGVPLSFVLREVADRLAIVEGISAARALEREVQALDNDDRMALLS